MRKGGRFPHQVSLGRRGKGEELAEDGVAGITSHGGL